MLVCVLCRTNSTIAISMNTSLAWPIVPSPRRVLRITFDAAHRLCAANMSDAENAKLYGKCNNPLGDGHGYLTEITVGGEYNERSGTLYDFVALRKAIRESLEPWQHRHLDLETEDFRNAPSTGENIVRALWPKIDNRLNQQLVRLRLWE